MVQKTESGALLLRIVSAGVPNSMLMIMSNNFTEFHLELMTSNAISSSGRSPSGSALKTV